VLDELTFLEQGAESSSKTRAKGLAQSWVVLATQERQLRLGGLEIHESRFCDLLARAPFRMWTLVDDES
jgi:hypothetical protein